MDITTIKNNFIKRHQLIRQAGITDETQVSTLDAATVKLFQEELSALLKRDYPAVPGSTPITGAMIKQCSDTNLAQLRLIATTFTPSSDPFNFALITPARQTADQVLIDSANGLFKSVSSTSAMSDLAPMKKSSSGFQPAPAASEKSASKTPKITSKTAKLSAHKGSARRTDNKVRGR